MFSILSISYVTIGNVYGQALQTVAVTSVWSDLFLSLSVVMFNGVAFLDNNQMDTNHRNGGILIPPILIQT